jgi:hypothetical protein
MKILDLSFLTTPCTYAITFNVLQIVKSFASFDQMLLGVTVLRSLYYCITHVSMDVERSIVLRSLYYCRSSRCNCAPLSVLLHVFSV